MVGQRVSAPAHGHNPLEIMTQQDYLVPGDTTLSCEAPMPSITFHAGESLREIARFTEEGFYYKGEFIDDAGEVHRLLKEVLGQMKTEQN